MTASRESSLRTPDPFAGSEDFFHRRVPLQEVAKARFHHHRDAQVGPPLFEKPQRRGQQNDVADGPEAKNEDARSGGKIGKKGSRVHTILDFRVLD